MPKVLMCQVDPQISSKLKSVMEEYGWAIHSCEGMLEMLRLIAEDEYEIVILNANCRNIEISTWLGAIKNLGKNPRIFLNLPNSEEILPSLLLMAEYPMINGALTVEKLLTAVQKTS